jgi:hypothetical protein
VKIVVQPISQERTAMNIFPRYLAVLVSFLILPIAAAGQSLLPLAGAVVLKTSKSSSRLPALSSHLVDAAATDSGLTYFDASTPTHAWPLVANYGTIAMAGVSERFTMPADANYIDSVLIGFDEIDDNVVVLLAPDTLYPTSGGDFHLLNFFDENAPVYSGGRISPPALVGRSRRMLRFPHVQVPKEFHVLVSSDLTAPHAMTIFVTGDSEATRERTAENSRSGFYGALIATQQTVAAILDGTFIPVGQSEPLYSNLDITVFSSTDPTGAQTEPMARGLAGVLSGGLVSSVSGLGDTSEDSYLYPNPCSNSVTVTKEGVESVELYDVLGRNVMSHSGPEPLDVKRLPNGRYLAVLHTGWRAVTQNLVIEHE